MPYLHTQKSTVSRKISPWQQPFIISTFTFGFLATKNKLNLDNDRMLEQHKKRLRYNELIKPQKKITKAVFIAVNNFQLRLKPSHQTILQTYRLSPSDGEISPFRFISPRLPVSVNNLPVFEIFSDASRQNSSSQIFRNTPI